MYYRRLQLETAPAAPDNSPLTVIETPRYPALELSGIHKAPLTRTGSSPHTRGLSMATVSRFGSRQPHTPGSPAMMLAFMFFRAPGYAFLPEPFLLSSDYSLVKLPTQAHPATEVIRCSDVVLTEYKRYAPR